MTNFTTSTPHDELFKTSARNPDTARDFMDIDLPKGLRELCDRHLKTGISQLCR